jgi:hypothetical protein
VSQDIDNAIESKNKKIKIQSLIHTQTNAKRYFFFKKKKKRLGSNRVSKPRNKKNIKFNSPPTQYLIIKLKNNKLKKMEKK